jgi:hypothetical protein
MLHVFQTLEIQIRSIGVANYSQFMAWKVQKNYENFVTDFDFSKFYNPKFHILLMCIMHFVFGISTRVPLVQSKKLVISHQEQICMT